MKKFLVVLHFYNIKENQYRRLYFNNKVEIDILKEQIKKDNKVLQKQGKKDLLCRIVYIAQIEKVLYEER